MGTAKHLPLQKFEPIDMALRDAITPRQAESRVNSSIISTNAVDKAAEFAHMTRFGSLEPAVQCLHLAFFEHGHKFLAQERDATQVLVLVHLRNLSLLYRSRVSREARSSGTLLRARKDAVSWA